MSYFLLVILVFWFLGWLLQPKYLAFDCDTVLETTCVFVAYLAQVLGMGLVALLIIYQTISL